VYPHGQRRLSSADVFRTRWRGQFFRDFVWTLGCFIFSPLSIEQTSTFFSGGVLGANHKYDILFNYDVILRLHSAIVYVIFRVFCDISETTSDRRLKLALIDVE